MITQAAFNRVLFGIRKQGGPAIVAGNCRYQCEVDGQTRRCAAGQFLVQSRYDERFEGLSVTDPGAMTMFSKSLLRGIDKFELRVLQTLHDDVAGGMLDFFPAWEAAMSAYARQHGLVYTGPST